MPVRLAATDKTSAIMAPNNQKNNRPKGNLKCQPKEKSKEKPTLDKVHKYGKQVFFKDQMYIRLQRMITS